MSCGLGRSATETSGTASLTTGDGGRFEHCMPSTMGAVGMSGGVSRGFDTQSNERAMLRAYASRRVSGRNPNLYSIIFRIDSNP